MESDSTLAQRTLAGETECYRTLVERYKDAVYGVALSKTGSFADAEDLAQEAFLAAYESLPKLKTQAKFGSWLYGIALNKTRMHLRSQSLDARRAQPQTSNPPPADEIAARRETQAAIISALKSLPDASRETATLYYIDGYSQKDISKFTNRPLGTIKRRLHDARKKLRKELVAMVETELKSSRPKREFTDHVLRKISQVRVYASDKTMQSLLLTDSKKRSFVICVGNLEAQAIAPWLSGKVPSEPTDLHSALVATLNRFGRRIEEVVVGELKASTFYGTIKVKSGKRITEIDSRPSDAINLAVRAGTPIFVDKDVAEQCLIRRKDGKPAAPRTARQRVKLGRWPVPFKTLSEVLRAVGRNPENATARENLHRAASKFLPNPPRLVGDPRKMEQLKTWAERAKGTNLEAVATGLLGAVYAHWHGPRSPRAVVCLEAAHRLLPADNRIAWDLATSYSFAGRSSDAFRTLEEIDSKFLQSRRHHSNFRNLRVHPEYSRILGKPPRDPQGSFLYAQLGFAVLVAKPKEKPARKRTAKTPVKMRRATESLKVRAQDLLGCGALLSVERMLNVCKREETKPTLFLDTEEGRAAATPLHKLEPYFIQYALAPSSFPRPLTHTTVSNVLRATDVKLDAVVLLKRTRSGIDAAFVVSADGKQAVIPVDAAPGIAVAVVSKSPVLITQTLAEKLYVRGKSGRPLTLRGAMHKLRKGGPTSR